MFLFIKKTLYIIICEKNLRLHNQYRFFCKILGDSFFVTSTERIIEKMDIITAVRKIISYEKLDG